MRSEKRGRHYAAEAVGMAVSGKSPKAFIDAITDPAVREIARVMARTQFEQIRFYAQLIAQHDDRLMRERYAEFKVPKHWRDEALKHAEYLINKKGGR